LDRIVEGLMRIQLGTGSALLAFGLLAFVEPALAQADGERWLAECRERDRDSRTDVHCEIRDLRVALPRDLLTIDGGRNGGISVVSSNRSDVLVKALVETRVRRGTDAVGVAKQIAVMAEDLIRADGPSLRNGMSETANGPISLRIPENYSAMLETGTVHGPMSIGVPMTVTINGRITRRVATQLGSGGPSIRVVTTNGPASVHR
jgi:hypothetical protein